MSSAPYISARYGIPPDHRAAGGHAKLYKAFDFTTEQSVAIKVFEHTSGRDERVLQRAWSQEIEAYSKIPKGPNLASLEDFGYLEDHTPYIVFEWCDGDLLGFFEEEPATWGTIRSVAADILAGLELLHAMNFVHRDIKPANVLYKDGRFKVADFGTIRMREVVDMGMTMSALGTAPYSPPELGDMSPSPAYDVYSFAVLVVVLLSKKLISTRDEVMSEISEIDIPEAVRGLLKRCLSVDPLERPQSAGTVEAIIRESETSGVVTNLEQLSVEVSPRSLQQYRSLLQSQSLTALDLVEDLSFQGIFGLEPSRGGGSPTIRVAGSTVMASLAIHSRYPWVLAITGVSRPPQRVMDLAYKNWLKGDFVWRISTTSPDPASSEKALLGFIDRLSEHEASRVAKDDSEPAIAKSWNKILHAKKEVASRRGSEIAYSSYRWEGNRVAFAVEGTASAPIGESRLVRASGRRLMRGEVESATTGEIVLYVVEGAVTSLPKSGRLEFDAELSRSKLDREKRALDRVFVGGARRKDLGLLLADPAANRPPGETKATISFRQPDLDPAKKKAVKLSLAAPDLFLVQGPPGTGKTTFIAELVAQALGENPDTKILVASQTHTALDHALEKIQELSPDTRFLRVGAAERLRESMEPWATPAQMAIWRAGAKTAAETYIDGFANARQISKDDLSVSEVSASLARASERIVAARARKQTLAEEQTELLQKMTENAQRAEQLLEMLNRFDRVALRTDDAPVFDELIERGLELAERFEDQPNGSSRSLEIEANLSQLESEIGMQSQALEANRFALIEALGLDPDVTINELVAVAELRASQESRQVTRLREIASEWDERFGSDREFQLVLMSRAQVVASTCVALTGVHGAEVIPFDLCIVDEASKATATEILVPLASSDKWVLVGDHRQLPPFIESDLGKVEVLEKFDLTPADVKANLFQMLAENLPAENVVALTHQHRMAPAIGGLISQVFYDGELTSEARAPSKLVSAALGAQVVWSDTRARTNSESRSGTSFRNTTEARMISKYLQRINWVAEQQGTDIVEVAVLTGYVAQVREIQTSIAGIGQPLSSIRVTVATVDSFQGQEADICLLSITRSNREKDLGFLSTPARLNVAMSRARDGLVIVGNTQMAIQRGGADRRKLNDVLEYIRSNVDCQVTEADL